MRCTAAWRSLLALLAVALHSGVALGQVDVSLRVLPQTAPAGDPHVLGFSGGVWNVPPFFEPAAQPILEEVRAGTVRACLQSEVLQPSRDFADLERRLAQYPLNDFLRRFKQRGGDVFVCIDAMPSWLAATKSKEKKGERPEWAKSRPRDYGEWARVVGAVVQHFNGRLGLDAGYEIWNEPNGRSFWSGDAREYFELYRASAEGARRADPRARVGGPAVAEWSSPTRESGERDLFLRSFIEWAGRTPAPALRLPRQPLDFVSWHGYYRDPSRHYAAVLPVVRGWLASAGYPRNTQLVVTEWNLGVAPPYPEGDLNATHVGAAFAGATLLAMREAGLDRQVFQLLFDPSKRGYTGGTFSSFGLPRSTFDVFRMASELRGQALAVETGDPWVRAAAFREGGRLAVLVAVFAPTERLTLRLLGDEDRAAHPGDPILGVDPNAVQAFFVGKGGMPSGVRPEQRARIEAMRETFRSERDRAARFERGATISLDLGGLRPARATRWSIDQGSAITSGELEGVARTLGETLQGSVDETARGLEVAPARREQFRQDLMKQGRVDTAMRDAPREEAAALAAAEDRVESRYGSALAKERERLRSGPSPMQLREPAAPIALRVGPHSLHLLVFEGLASR